MCTEGAGPCTREACRSADASLPSVAHPPTHPPLTRVRCGARTVRLCSWFWGLSSTRQGQSPPPQEPTCNEGRTVHKRNKEHTACRAGACWGEMRQEEGM